MLQILMTILCPRKGRDNGGASLNGQAEFSVAFGRFSIESATGARENAA